MGAFITFTVIKSMDALGPAKAVMLIVISQLIIAYLIELFGLFGVEKQPFSWRKAIGALVGLWGWLCLSMSEIWCYFITLASIFSCIAAMITNIASK